jgi:hypothetical protein
MNVMAAEVFALLGFVLLLIEHNFILALVEGVSLFGSGWAHHAGSVSGRGVRLCHS